MPFNTQAQMVGGRYIPASPYADALNALAASVVRGSQQAQQGKSTADALRALGVGNITPDQGTALVQSPPDVQAVALKTLAEPHYGEPYTDQVTGATLQRDLGTNQAKQVSQDPFGHSAGSGSAKFATMHASGRMSVNMNGQQVYADGAHEPVNFLQDKPLMTQQIVTDSAGNTREVWQKIPFEGAGAPPGGPAPAGAAGAPGPQPAAPPAAPAPAAPPPAPNAPSTTLSTGPQAAAHAGNVTAEQEAAKTFEQRRASLPGAKQYARLAIQKTNNIMDRVDDVANDPNLSQVLGANPGRVIAMIPGLDLSNVRAKISALQNALSLQGLTELRDSAKTGGGVGQVTEGEYKILHDMLSSLNENMTTDEFLRQLALIKRRTAGTGWALEKAYTETYGPEFQKRFPGEDVNLEFGTGAPTKVANPIPPAPAAPAPAGPVEPLDALLSKYPPKR